MPNTELSDEALRKLWKPQISEEDACRVLDESYVPKGSQRRIIRPLDSYDDVNYQVEIDGIPFLLKIHNGVESDNYLKVLEGAGGDHFKVGHQSSVIHLQTALMQVLHQHQIPASIPQPPERVRSTDDKEWPSQVPISVHQLPVVDSATKTKKLVVRLLSWTSGTPMSSFRVLPAECLCETGQALGKIALAFDKVAGAKDNTDAVTRMDASLQTPARRYHQWDGKNTADLRGFVQYIKEERRQKMIKSIIQRFSTDIVDSGDAEQFRKGVLHGDFNDANILLNESDHTFSGVIDFGDSVESWRVLDVTIAMAYSMLSVYAKPKRSISAAALVLRGFHSVYPLTAVERKHLVLLVACRLACSVTLGSYSFQQNPENKYLLLHAEPAWAALELIWGYDDDTLRRENMASALQKVFVRACCHSSDTTEAVDISDLCFPDPEVFDLLKNIRCKSPTATGESVPASKKPRSTKVLTFVTGNKKKLEEVQRILQFDAASRFSLENFKLDLPELQGDPIDIAKEKCRLAAEKIGGPVITEDTSLCFHALKGLPGPYIKWFLEKCGHDGLNNMIGSDDDKTGYAQTVVAFSMGPGQEPKVFDGRTEGIIVPARGSLDFGWDPIFQPKEGGGLTYAEMSKGEKDAISHRSRAFAQLRTYLASL